MHQSDMSEMSHTFVSPKKKEMLQSETENNYWTSRGPLGGALNFFFFFGEYVLRGFSKVGSREQVFLEK